MLFALHEIKLILIIAASLLFIPKYVQSLSVQMYLAIYM